LVDTSAIISILPLDCKVSLDGVVPIPINYGIPFSFKRSAERILNFAEITLEVRDPMHEIDKGIYCPVCERGGQHCAFSSQRNRTFCIHHGIASNWKAPYTNHICFVTEFLI
jgi:hypothetical protein